MHRLDWIIACLPLLIVATVCLYARRYVHSVADFLTGNRSAGRYLLCIAGGELQAGAVIFVFYFEIISHAGFTNAWWRWLAIPVGLLVRISGFVVYRYRETRAMTLPQFFEMRYTRAFRVFTGGLCFLAGITNFGIIPAVGARCLVYFLGLPESLPLGGAWQVPTFVALMAGFLAVTLVVALSGGAVTILLVNCVEGIVAQLFYLVIIFTVLAVFRWPQIVTVLTARPPHQSMLNPYDSLGIKDFNIWLELMTLFASVYGLMAWPVSGSYSAAALTPHEGRMANVLNYWREIGKLAVITLLGVAAVTYLHHADFAAGAARVQAHADGIADAHTRQQMITPMAVAAFLPTGVRGALCAVLLMGIFGGDATHLLSWGSIFVQDVLSPLRRTPFTPRAHLLALRLSIAGVAGFAFVFGATFRQTQYITMWWSVTTAIYVGGAGSAIIGGLYWKKGTAAAAWAALLTGSSLSVGGIIVQSRYGAGFFLNGAQVGFFASLTAIAVYVVVSLLTCREDFDLDRMLHRGRYASAENTVAAEPWPPRGRGVDWGRFIGIDQHFTRADKWMSGGVLAYSLLYFAIFVVGTVWNLLAPWPVAVWATFWHIVGIGVPVFFAVVTGIWFTWGGLRDVRRLFGLLSRETVDVHDDGTVADHQHAGEQPAGRGASI